MVNRNTVDEYVERAIRLAENHQERLELRRHIIENNGLQTLFYVVLNGSY